MTKELQKELLEKVKPGTKPSHLKRSRSVGDIPQAPPLPKTLTKSAEELELGSSNLSQELKKTTDLTSLLQEQLKAKQQELEKLREQLELDNSPQANPTQELDQSLMARHSNLKNRFKQYQKSKSLDKELTENIEQASTELINQDQKITQLRNSNNKLQQENSNLHRDLKLSQRLAELRSNESSFDNERQLRKEPFLEKGNWPSLPSWGLIWIALSILALWFLTFPKRIYPKNQNDL